MFSISAVLSGPNFKTIELTAQMTIIKPEDAYQVSVGSPYNYIYGISGFKI